MRLHSQRTIQALALTMVLPWIGCSQPAEPPQGGTGGSSTSTGGAAGSFGTAQGGQVTGAGGATTGSGGELSSGGSVTTNGGASARGGTSSSSPQGGASSGGRSAGGGAAGGGQGGATPTSGGSKNDAGAAGAAGGGNPSAAAPSAGCGKATELKSGRATIDVAGKSREYILALPDNYDSSKPYRLIFGWHPWGGSADQVAKGGYYGLVNQAKGSAIFVAGEGLDFGGNGKGWGNSNGEDIALLEAMLTRFRSQLCIDENRIFSTGFSFGGMFSFAAGCSATSMMRAIAPMAGNTSVAGCTNGTRQVALMGFHGVDDTVVAIDGGRKGRDAFVQRNKCTTQTAPATSNWCEVAGQNYQPCSCVSYQGCAEGYPVTWCEFKGTHMPAPNSGATLWSFFSQF